jgi:hypothetical protein
MGPVRHLAFVMPAHDPMGVHDVLADEYLCARLRERHS